METYQKEYLKKLGSRIEALQAARNAWHTGVAEAATSARRIAHTLRGSGGTYGFPKISTLAAAVEDAAAADLTAQLDVLIQYLRLLSRTEHGPIERILIIDDSEEMRLILGVILKRQGYAVLQAENAVEARQKLMQAAVSLILLDLVLPDTDGRNYLIELKEDLATAAIPVIVLSAKNSPQIKAECYALGAEDYFEKPIDPALLTTKVAATFQMNRNLQQNFREDDLTGLLNRAAFREQYDQLLAPVGTEPHPVCLAIVDLDHFKQVNDQYGHLVGDGVLKFVTRTIRRQLRSNDVFGRWGGEEFIILLPTIDCTTAQQLLDEAQHELQTHPFELPESGDKLPVSFSAGIVEVAADSSFDETFGLADKYLYAAKDAGRKQVVISLNPAETVQRSILLAEDDDLTAEFIRHRLSRSDFQITHFPQGDRAFEAATQQVFDLIITDVKMPGMDGFELVQRIRQDSLNQQTPVIILTSMGRESDISRGLDLGANDYILKPFSPTELLARVHRLLK